jgi:hypothetical protein
VHTATGKKIQGDAKHTTWTKDYIDNSDNIDSGDNIDINNFISEIKRNVKLSIANGIGILESI